MQMAATISLRDDVGMCVIFRGDVAQRLYILLNIFAVLSVILVDLGCSIIWIIMVSSIDTAGISTKKIMILFVIMLQTLSLRENIVWRCLFYMFLYYLHLYSSAYHLHVCNSLNFNVL